MRRRSKICSICGIIVTLAVGWFVSRPIIMVRNATPLWATEYDASRQHTIYPGPGTPLSRLRSGDRLRIVWDTYGKDYWAFVVLGPKCQFGWVLYGQDGIPIGK